VRIRKPVLATVAVALVLALVFSVLGLELADSQTRSHNEITTEVHNKALLSAALIDSLFQSVESSKSTDTATYKDPVSTSTMDVAAKGEAYAVLTDGSGSIIATSSGFDRATGLATSIQKLTSLASSHQTYMLGDLTHYQGNLVSELAVPFPAQGGGTRVLITGINVPTLGAFFGTELKSIPGVKGQSNYLVDGQGRVIASSDPSVQPGATPPDVVATGRSAGSVGSHYFARYPLANSGWQIVLVAPSGPLFASVSGTREYVPWVILAGLVIMAILAILLGWRVMRSAVVVSDVNAKLASVNHELSDANDTLQKRAAELARSNEELESFASIASHDLQEPLRKVRTFTEQITVLEGDRLSDKGRDYLERANAAAERMQRLIEDLLRFSRVSTQGRPFEQVDLAEVARRVQLDLEGQIEDSGGRVIVGDLPVLAADPLQMQQLLQNLISNALKFQREGVAPEIKVDSSIVGADIRLTVADNGIGFEPRYAARIFRIFERLHGRTEYPGTGIGLALCRKIADRHGGTIDVESEPGVGSTFVVTLPRQHPEAEELPEVNLEEIGSSRDHAGV
jgi:signal transduction histidine kinase